jgi:hypothetical protein
MFHIHTSCDGHCGHCGTCGRSHGFLCLPLPLRLPLQCPARPKSDQVLLEVVRHKPIVVHRFGVNPKAQPEEARMPTAQPVWECFMMRARPAMRCRWPNDEGMDA